MGKIKDTARRTLTFSVCLALSVSSLSARTIEVGKGKAFVSISKALRTAKPHDVILVYGNKVYKEHLLIDKPVLLRGTGHPVVDGGQRGNVVSTYHYGN